jgi:hypothetical protein
MGMDPQGSCLASLLGLEPSDLDQTMCDAIIVEDQPIPVTLSLEGLDPGSYKYPIPVG